MNLLRHLRPGLLVSLLGAIVLLTVACSGGRAPAAESGESGDAGPITTGSVVTYNFGGYASKVSVAQGESLDFHISLDAGSTTDISIYREGTPRRLMKTMTGVTAGTYDCNGLYAAGCDWPVAASLTVPTDWPSGAYVAEFKAGSTRQRKIIFWVREDNPGSTARILFLSSVNTHQAYNAYGGGSLYGFGDSVKATKVSFDRPFENGVGKYAFWEAVAIPWLEANGYAVEYATTYDLHFHPDLLSHYDVAMVAGHSEYWTWDARQQLRRFLDEGGRFLSLSGNTMWWQVRYEDDGRTMVGYKDWKKDPEKDRTLNTNNPWDHTIYDTPFTYTGLHWPYGGYPGANGDGYYAVNTSHWIYEGTGVTENKLIGKGSSLETSIHDKESDGMAFNCATDGSTLLGPLGNTGTPHNFTILGLTTVYSNMRDLDNFTMMGIYTTPAGGALFSAGTTGWANGLSDPTIGRITRNVLDRFLAGNFPAEPEKPDTAYYLYDRFNCYDIARGRFKSTAWQSDIARNNFYESSGSGASRLTLACGVDGAGMEFKPVGETRYQSQVRPNWARADALYSHFYMKLSGLTLASGNTFNVLQQYADDRTAEPLPLMELQLQRQGNSFQMRYQPVGGNLPWVNVPSDRFFLVETGWNRLTGRVALWIDGAGYDQTANLSAMPALNRVDLGSMRVKGGVSGLYCLDEFIVDGHRFGYPPDPGPTPTATPTSTATATPTATATATTTLTPSPTATATATATQDPNATPTATPTATSTGAATASPTPSPTATEPGQVLITETPTASPSPTGPAPAYGVYLPFVIR
ncbi:N,N-dimethylformamidase beta subunit family domain-containing protein [Promineifilum sp.]|uniref:N,N-dimethylformamidase beta subunit family domain-containing protein n=1 Tax=Promineifilum sp. TaxID=2664178 RepID=UPI0035B231D9